MLIPDITNLMGQDVKDLEAKMGSFQVRGGQTGAELTAWTIITTKTSFGANAVKLIAEYQEMASRNASFTFVWTGGLWFNFNINFQA